jgi:hypothetical protein
MKKYWIFVIFLMVKGDLLFAHGKVELPSGYVELDDIIVSLGKKNYELLLPYNKPDGIDRIFTKDKVGILIHRIIGDGKLILPRRQYFSNDEAIAIKYEKFVDTKRDILEFKMTWFALGARITNENIREGLFYETLDRKKNIYIFNIPYGIREIYITYSILFPQNENQVIEQKTVYFRINWQLDSDDGAATWADDAEDE